MSDVETSLQKKKKNPKYDHVRIMKSIEAKEVDFSLARKNILHCIKKRGAMDGRAFLEWILDFRENIKIW